MFDVRKNSDEVIRIAEMTYKSQQYVDIRVWVVGDSDNELIPTKRGVRFRKVHAQEIIDAIESIRQGKGSARKRA